MATKICLLFGERCLAHAAGGAGVFIGQLRGHLLFKTSLICVNVTHHFIQVCENIIYDEVKYKINKCCIQPV